MSEPTTIDGDAVDVRAQLLNLVEEHHDQLVLRTNPTIGAESYIGYRETSDPETTGWVHWLDYDKNPGTRTIRQTSRLVAGYSASINCELVMRSVAPRGLQLALIGFDLDTIDTSTQLTLNTWE